MSGHGRLDYVVQPGGALLGTMRVPGDKSISHRAILLGGVSEGTTRITGFLEGEDTLATLAAFSAMGVPIERDGAVVTVHGRGLHGLEPAPDAIDLGNSGTAMRLMAGLLAGQRFDSVLTGDASLITRPMARVMTPLNAMGACVLGTDQQTAPLRIKGGQPLQGIRYELPVASAQVKSCVLLAGLYAEGDTEVVEPEITRDHTERMLEGFGYEVRRGASIAITGGHPLSGSVIEVPGDISSAAFFLVGACIAPGSKLTLEGIGINPTRDGVLRVLQAMGGDLTVRNQRWVGGEPVADIDVEASTLSGIDIPAEWVPLALDEFPVLMVAAAAANGVTTLTGAAELRVKESDRITAIAEGLTRLGVRCETNPDGMVVHGGGLRGGSVSSFTDHRIAMAFSVAALAASGPVTVEDCGNVATSFPDFVNLSQDAGLVLEERFAE